MNQPLGALWSDVDHYLEASLHAPDPVLEEILRSSREAGLPSIQVSASHGKFLWMLARILKARRILEVGTLGGYSTVWMARALEEGGRLFTLEADAHHACVARRHFERAGLQERITLLEGPALSTLPTLTPEKDGPFDLAFIDADKRNNLKYFEAAHRLMRRGGIIAVDNVVREGAILREDPRDASAQGVRELFRALGARPGVDTTVLQTVGHKGHDGLSLTLVL